MTEGGRTSKFLTGSIFILLLAASGQAGTLNFTTTPFTGTDQVSWGSSLGTLGSPDNVGYTFSSTGGNDVTVSFSNPVSATDGDGAVFEAGGSTFGWPSGSVFTSGSFLLGTNLNTSVEPGTPQVDFMTLSFSNPVSAIGVYIQDLDTTDPFSVRVSTASNGGFSSPAESSGANGGAIFIGIYDLSGTNDISSITFSTTQSASGGTPDDFVIGTAQLGPAISPVPEPRSVLLLGALFALCLIQIRRGKSLRVDRQPRLAEPS